jgi:nucleotide-binding universal stress UspA family protein
MSRYAHNEVHRAGPILVAVDGHDGDWNPLEWAASEAAARGRPLRIVHAISWPPVMFDAYGVLSANQGDTFAQQAGELVLDEAATRARELEPALRINTRLQAGLAHAAILREGRSAEMIVIGRGRDVGWLLSRSRSLSLRVARHANSSVVVVGRATQSSRAQASGRVVIGLEDSGAHAAALRSAFLAAQHGGVGLAVLHSGLTRSVIDAVRMWRDVFPQVAVQQKLVGEGLARALVAESENARLLVLCSEPSGFLHFSAFESVRRTVLRSAKCPVAVIRTPFDLPRGVAHGRFGGRSRLGLPARSTRWLESSDAALGRSNHERTAGR